MTDDLVEAIKQGDVQRIHALVNDNPDTIHTATPSPLLLSIYMGKPDITTVLLQYLEDLTLHEAAAVGDVDRVAALVTASPNRVDEHGSDGFTPLGLAAYFGHQGVVELLLQHGADINLPSSNTQHVTPLQSAISAKHRPVIDLLLTHGADVNVTQERGITPLMQAAHQGDVALVKQLLEHGADVAAKSTKGRDAIWYAEDVDAHHVAQVLQAAMLGK